MWLPVRGASRLFVCFLGAGIAEWNGWEATGGGVDHTIAMQRGVFNGLRIWRCDGGMQKLVIQLLVVRSIVRV